LENNDRSSSGQLGCPRGTAEQRRAAEDRGADDEEGATAEDVREAAGDDQEGSRREHVAAHDPLQCGRRRVEIVGHLRDRGLDREEVELHREHAERGAQHQCSTRTAQRPGGRGSRSVDDLGHDRPDLSAPGQRTSTSIHTNR
jgi:hypothetical protein